MKRYDIYVITILSEEFLSYADSCAFRGKSIAMDDLASKPDRFFKTNGYAVLQG